MKKTVFSFSIIILTISLIACSTNPPSAPIGNPANFVQTDGRLLRTPDGNPFLIKGIAFGNDVWGNPADNSFCKHHTSADFSRVKSMGFNSIRFYINYRLFEEDSNPYQYKQSGFAWLDKNIADAKAAGIYLILNMHYPQGGFQSIGDGDALWTNPVNQSRLIALWKAIARRYASEPTIIGYGLVNEPVPSSNTAQWTNLAQKIINEIRTVDSVHILFVERVCWARFAFTNEETTNLLFPAVTDPASKSNLVYEYHMYNPMPFTHQNASWIPAYIGKFTQYPDPQRFEMSGEQWQGCSNTNPQLATNANTWTDLNGTPFTVNNPNYQFAKPVIQVQSIGSKGKVWFDDMQIEIFDSTGTLVNTIIQPLGTDENRYYWSNNNSGALSVASDSLISDKSCLLISGSTNDANCSIDSAKFKVQQGFSYKISGKARGENIAPGALVRFRIDFSSATSVQNWTKSYLQESVNEYISWSERKNVPVYLGEFGAIIDSFKQGRGGDRWLSDMLDILKAGNVHYNYHTWHETNFGIFTNSSAELPDPAQVNQSAIDLFTAKQN